MVEIPPRTATYVLCSLSLQQYRCLNVFGVGMLHCWGGQEGTGAGEGKKGKVGGGRGGIVSGR